MAATQPAQPTTRYIIARYNEDISWVEGLPGGEAIVCDKGEGGIGTSLPNVGREGHTYLWFLTSHYRNLPDVMVFCQAGIHEHVPRGIDPVVHLKGLAAEAWEKGVAGFVHTSIPHDFNIWQAGELKDRYGVADPERIAFGDWFAEAFGEEFPDTQKGCHVAYGGIFAMRKDMILTRGRGFYKRLLGMLSTENNPLEGHFMERSWYYMPLRRASQVEYYAICLKGRPERVEAVEKMRRILPHLRVEDAIDATKFTHDYISGLIRAKYIVTRSGKYVDGMLRPYQLGAIGCALSHRTVLEHVMNQKGNKRYAIVFEDDVKILPGFHEKVEDILEIIESRGIKFDFCNLSVMPHQQKLYKMYKVMSLVKSPAGLCGTQCYLVCRDTVINVLMNLMTFSDPIDEQLSRAIELRYMHLVGEKMIAGTEATSYIQSAGSKKIEGA